MKVCVDCRYYKANHIFRVILGTAKHQHSCLHPTSLDRVSGAPGNAVLKREYGDCGPEGHNFEPRVSGPRTTD